jgi:hypothetical protein
MHITSIRESGNSNSLMWAISNGADIKDNLPLVSIINDDLFFQVTIDGVNMYQLFRLTQLYRSKLKVCSIHRSEVPDTKTLDEMFPGFGERASSLLDHSIGIVTQMLSDNDIIADGTAQLYLPMITTTYAVQIPFSFVDAVESMTEDECRELFTMSYPSTLETIVEKGSCHGFYRAIMILIERMTENIRYDSKYEQLLNRTKYFALREYPEKLFKTGLLSFSKFDAISRSEVRCSLFNPNVESMRKSMKRMAQLKTPLEITAVIQLPIYHMQILESSYFPEDLRISHRSSINNILDNGMVVRNFNFKDDDPNEESEIDRYKVRILESKLRIMEFIEDVLRSDTNFHSPSLFAMLPSIYKANAVISFSTADLPNFLNNNTYPVIQEMFEEIQKLVRGVEIDIQKV